MATKITEPYVKASENIRKNPVQLNIDGSSNIGGVITSPTGPRLAFVSGPKDFLSKYTLDGQVPRNASISFLNAYYLSFSAGLVITRAMNTTAVSGLLFKSKKVSTTKILIQVDDESLWGFKLGTKYFWCNSDDSNFNNFISTITEAIDSEGEPVYDAELIEAVTALSESAVYCTGLTDLASKVATVISKSVTYDSNIGGLVISDSYSFTEDKTTTVAMALSSVEDSNNYALESKPIKYKDGSALTETDTLTLSFNTNISSNWVFVIGSMAYYNGAIDKSKYEDYSLTLCKSLDDLLTSLNGIGGISASSENNDEDATYTIKLEYSKGNRLLLGEDHSGVTPSLSEPTSVSSDLDDMLFAIYPDQPQSTDAYVMEVSKATSETFYLTLKYGSVSNTYEVSLNSDSLDASGSNAFIENLNSIQSQFTIVTNAEPKLDGDDTISDVTPSISQTFSFGNSGLDNSASNNVACLVNALYALEDQEMYDIEALTTFGIVDLQFIKVYTMIGKTNDWFTPVDIPYNMTNVNSIKGYFMNIDNSSNIEAMGPFDKNIGLTGWRVYIAASTLYYSKIMANKSAKSEFAPVFDETNGILDYTDPVYLFGKKDRETLLNFKCPVNFVIYNQRLNAYYFNDNRTHQSVTDIVSEEQNRRMVNKIKKDCVRLLKSFKGRLNTSSTRSSVYDVLNSYFRTTLMTQQYKPNDYQIICDESNNTTELITANKLAVTVRVKLDNAVKYIDVLVDVFPLGVDFTA